MNTVIRTNYGKVEGFIDHGLNKWLGIPFAKPPVGELRFRRAQPCESWEGVKECKKHSNKHLLNLSSYLLLIFPKVKIAYI